jgi:hypothetical protein
MKMKWLTLTLAITSLAYCAACSRAQQAQTKVQRQPLEKQKIELKSPVGYEWRDKGYDPQTGEPITYDHRPRVEPVDKKAGKYAFKWIGYDGKEKVVIFQRADSIDVIVSAAASKKPEGQYLYTYVIENRPSSGTHLSGFTVQNFASDVKRITRGGYGGQMSNLISQFREGNWLHFGSTFIGHEVAPGRHLKLELVSSAPPGLVGCRAYGGESALNGAGEHMPFALESLLPGYEEWPRGYTIGPNEGLKSLEPSERAKHLLDSLPHFQKAGWITDSVLRQYERHLRSGDLKAVSKRADQDLKDEQITTEVFAIIEAMK